MNNLLTALTLALLFVLTYPAVAALDADFNPDANETVFCIAMQPDGRIVIGGGFTTLAGVARSHIARLSADGTLDRGFNPNANGLVICIVVQPDGKILFGGDFTTVGGMWVFGGKTRNRIARLNADGTLDSAFDPNINDGLVNRIIAQPDGKIIIAGYFTSVGGVARNHIARLDPDGTLDPTFDPDVGGVPRALSLQPDGKIMVAGDIFSIGGTKRKSIVRLSQDGTLDTTFDPHFPYGNGVINALMTQPDGKTIFAGAFTTVGTWRYVMGGVSRNNIARLDPDGTLDKAYAPDANGCIFALAPQADGNLIVGGSFAAIGFVPVVRNCIARLHSDGTVDKSFSPNVNGHVLDIDVQPDGKIIIAGEFTSVGGVGRNHIARLLAQ